MARRKYEFRPDPDGSGILNKLYPTPSQRRSSRKWGLYAVAFVVCLVLQDAVLSRFRFLGGSVDLAVSLILLVSVYQGLDSGCVFALVAGCVYAFSGSAPGIYVIILIPLFASVMAAFRESYLQWNRNTGLICAGVAAAAYEMSIFLIGLLMGYTYTGRAGHFVMTAILGAAVMPVLYPTVERIGQLGGETWNE